MEKKIIDNKKREWTIGSSFNFDRWIVGFDWWYSSDILKSKNTQLNLHLLCWTLWFEMWRWSSDEKEAF